jgi:transposase-like protein
MECSPLSKELVETSLEAEITSHLNSKHSEGKPNRRNGYSKKQLKAHQVALC